LGDARKLGGMGETRGAIRRASPRHAKTAPTLGNWT